MADPDQLEPLLIGDAFPVGNPAGGSRGRQGCDWRTAEPGTKLELQPVSYPPVPLGGDVGARAGEVARFVDRFRRGGVENRATLACVEVQDESL